MPNSPTTNSTTASSTTASARSTRAAAAGTAATAKNASLDTAGPISAAAADDAEPLAPRATAHRVEQAGSAGLGGDSTGRTASTTAMATTADEPGGSADASSPNQGGPAVGEGADDRNADHTDAGTNNGDPADQNGDPSEQQAGVDTAAGTVSDRVWTALLAHPAATATELATAAAAGRSTVSKLLAGWADEARVSSTASTTLRAARRWTAVSVLARPAPSPTSGPHADIPRSQAQRSPVRRSQALTGVAAAAVGSRAPRRRPDGSAANQIVDTDTDTDTDTGTGTDTAAGTNAESAAAAQGQCTPKSAAGAAVTSAASPRTPGLAGSRAGRLGAGQLRGLVEEFLAEHPGGHGPVEIGHALGRSSGAIANALERLVDSGWAERTSDRPKRYRFAGDDADTPTDGNDAAGDDLDDDLDDDNDTDADADTDADNGDDSTDGDEAGALHDGQDGSRDGDDSGR